MEPAPIPENEAERMHALLDLDILDTGYEATFGELVELAAFVSHTPMAALSLVDTERQWFKSTIGLEESELPRDISFCGHTISLEHTLVVPDTLRDPRFVDNPLVTGDLHVRFYAGSPLIVDDHHVGTLCVVDRRPRTFLTDERRALEILARQASAQLELRRRRADDPGH